MIAYEYKHSVWKPGKEVFEWNQKKGQRSKKGFFELGLYRSTVKIHFEIDLGLY